MSKSLLTVEECEEEVKGPGRFEGQSSYVPYFFLGEDGGWDGDLLIYRVTKEDRQMFPELKGRRTVKIRVTNEGFIEEV